MEQETSTLRYIAAEHVDTPAGRLDGTVLVNPSDEMVGRLDGIIIDPATIATWSPEMESMCTIPARA